ncbi:MAG: ice-binding family protein [Kofleriaceae bacterium]
MSACGDNIRFLGDAGGGSDAQRADGNPDDGAPGDAPVVVSSIPAPSATDVVSTTLISATFDMAMASATISDTTFLVRQDTTPIAGVVTLSSPETATFDPDVDLVPSLVYTATLTTEVTALDGTPLATEYVWTFTVAADPTPPQVTSTSPAHRTNKVSINKRPTATFSKAMDPASINAQSFLLKRGAVPVPGTVTLNAATNTAQFTPTVALAAGVLYTATITTAARDTSGNALATAFTWTFTTDACSMELVALRGAARFGVLAASTVTNTGPTMVTGDVGVSPGTAITGFPPGIINGAKQEGNPTAAQGSTDLTTAYLDAAGRTQCAVTVAGNLGGRTLGPGLYKSTSSLAISSGNLTLDAKGDADAVWIFQMASTLTVTDRRVILAGGARAANIFWQVGTSATLGTDSVFAGNVMALAAVTLGTRARLDGRALARTGAVALDNNVIVAP